MKIKIFISSFIIEIVASGYTLIIAEFFNRYNNYFLFYVLPIMWVLNPHYPFAETLPEHERWKYPVILFILFFLNVFKWVGIIWLYRKGYKKITVCIIVIFILLVFISYSFNDIGF